MGGGGAGGREEILPLRRAEIAFPSLSVCVCMRGRRRGGETRPHADRYAAAASEKGKEEEGKGVRAVWEKDAA